MKPLNSSIVRLAAQRVTQNKAPEATGQAKPGKEPILEVFEDLFEQVPAQDNKPNDTNREMGKANFSSRAPQGMQDWDFEYDDNKIIRSSDKTYQELKVGEHQLEFVTARENHGGSGSITRVIYDPDTDASTTQKWSITGGSPGTIALIPDDPAPRLVASPEKRKQLRSTFGALFQKPG